MFGVSEAEQVSSTGLTVMEKGVTGFLFIVAKQAVEFPQVLASYV